MGFDPKRKPMLTMREWWNGRHDTLRGYCSLGRAGSSPALRTICEVSATGKRTCLKISYQTNLLYIIMNTKQLGNLTELQCITRLYELGCAVSIPFGNSEKYDAIIEYNNVLYKVQIKHGAPTYEGDQVSYLTINCRWTGHNNTGFNSHKYSAEDVDFFATFYEGECYLIPQKECSSAKILRILPPKNGQTKGICFLEKYKAMEVLKQL